MSLAAGANRAVSRGSYGEERVLPQPCLNDASWNSFYRVKVLQMEVSQGRARERSLGRGLWKRDFRTISWILGSL